MPMVFKPLDYKKAMLIFYEQNNLYAFKQIFIDQFEFAVKESSISLSSQLRSTSEKSTTKLLSRMGLFTATQSLYPYHTFY